MNLKEFINYVSEHSELKDLSILRKSYFVQKSIKLLIFKVFCQILIIF